MNGPWDLRFAPDLGAPEKITLERLASGVLTFRLNEPFSPVYEPLRADFNRALETLQETMREVAARSRS